MVREQKCQSHHEAKPLTIFTVFDLPEEILATLQVKAESSEVSFQADHEQKSQGSSAAQRVQEDLGPTTTPATSCTLCGLTFATLLEQRSHIRSDLHGYNLRQKLRGLRPVNENEFEKLVGGTGIGAINQSIH